VVDAEITRSVILAGDMPPYCELAYYLWGSETDFDSDGDSETPQSIEWRELTLIRRPGYDQRIDIDPDPASKDRLIIRGSTKELAERAIDFLRNKGAIE